MLVILVCLWEIPDRTRRFVVAAAPHDGGSRMIVNILVSPLPNIPDHIHNAKRARAARMFIHIAGGHHDSTAIRKRSRIILVLRTPIAEEFASGGNRRRYARQSNRRKPFAITPWIN